MAESNSTDVEYRDIAGFPGYRVGNNGSVWCCRRRGAYPIITDRWRLLKPHRQHHAYTVTLYRNRKGFPRFVHQLVLTAFVGPCPPGMQCRHFPDRDTSNNRLSNLQWGTAKENSADQSVHGTRPKGSKHGNAKLSEEAVRSILREHTGAYGSLSRLAKKYGVTPQQIWYIVNGRQWKQISAEADVANAPLEGQ